jgi:hypothetical protein
MQPSSLPVIAMSLALAITGVGCGDEETCEFVPDDTHTDAPPAESEAVFDPTILHRVELVVSEENLCEMSYFDPPSWCGTVVGPTSPYDEPWLPASLTYDGVTLPSVGIRIKGNSTRVNVDDRASFSVKVDELDHEARLLGLERFALNSALHDMALVRAPTAYALARAVGLPAPRTAYAEVHLNGEPYGIYVVAEAVKAPFLAAWFGEERAWGNLYEIAGWDMVDNDVGTDPIANAFGFELHDGEEGRCLDDLRELHEALAEAGDHLGDLPDILAAHFDVDALLRFIALERVLGRGDGFQVGNNYYLYRVPELERFVVLASGMDTLLYAPVPPIDPWELDATSEGLIELLVASPPVVEQYRAIADEVAAAFDDEPILADLDRLGGWLDALPASNERLATELGFIDDAQADLREIVQTRAAYLRERLDAR